MASYFLDTSAIIKRYIPEPGQSLIVGICDPEQGHDLYISQAAMVEVVATLCRKARERSISIRERDMLIDTFRRDSQSVYGVQIVSNAVYISAGNLCRLYSLRAYDAIQLACLLRVRDKALLNQASAPIFVCADTHLCTVALIEGLSIENPINYP